MFTGTNSTGLITLGSSTFITIRNLAIMWNSNNVTGPIINGNKVDNGSDTAHLLIYNVVIEPDNSSHQAAPTNLITMDGSHDVAIEHSTFQGGTYSIYGKKLNSITTDTVYATAPTYSSGGTFTGTGSCVYAAANGGGSSAQITVNVSAGAFSSFAKIGGSGGTGYTSMPTSWTYVSGASCSTTITTSGGSLAVRGGYANRIIIQDNYFSQATTSALHNADYNWLVSNNSFEPIAGSPAPAGAYTFDGGFSFNGLSFQTNYFSDEGVTAGTWLNFGNGSGLTISNGNFIHASGSETGIAFTGTLTGATISGNYIAGSGTGVGISFGTTPPTAFSAFSNSFAGFSAGNNASGTQPNDYLSLGHYDLGSGYIGGVWSPQNISASTCDGTTYVYTAPLSTGTIPIYCAIPAGTLTAGISSVKFEFWIFPCTANGAPSIVAGCTAANSAVGTPLTLSVSLSASSGASGTGIIAPAAIAANLKVVGDGWVSSVSGTAQTLDGTYWTGGSAISNVPVAGAFNTGSGAVYLMMKLTDTNNGTDGFLVRMKIVQYQ
jgi:hypothetical protein